MGSAGIAGDRQRASASKQRVAEDRLRRNSGERIEVCPWCDGTGNEFYSMYRKCPKCDGRGTVREEER